ncbi:hypothetical protein MPSEU_000223200 [Mayamaea pseudoterrestris]|nr:hypothetical protein MPSEU_000223200 [Mayamaea pseudoterrestris]
MRNEKSSKKGGGKGGDKRKSSASTQKFKKNKYQKTEIVFDADARRKHLQGFSTRKRERRVFGLAMQKVKDRKARLADRQSEREARKEQVEFAEKQKEEMMEVLLAENAIDRPTSYNDDGSVNDDRSIEKVEMYQDGQTESMWGGQVVVKVSTHVPGESSDDEEEAREHVPRQPRAKKADEQQEFAGRVERYMPQVKASLPGKKKSAQQRKTKGMHGAATMKGMASNPGDFKLAQKALNRASTKTAGARGGGKRRR